MLDFLKIADRETTKRIHGRLVKEIYPKFIIKKSKDLMIRGGDFYAVWNENDRLWSKDEDTLSMLIDRELDLYYENHKDKFDDYYVQILYMWDSDTKSMDRFHKYIKEQMRNNYCQLDSKLIFSDQEVKKEDYASKTLSYPLERGSIEAYEELVNVLYTPEERQKFEWAIGAVITGASKSIEKAIVFYGQPGTGKSTILNIISEIFEDYVAYFDAKAIGSASNEFALEQLKDNPLVAICHEADLSHLDNNERFNSLISHEIMSVNEKHKALYTTKFYAFMFIGTNKVVRITDGKSGLIRRIIDIQPSNKKVSKERYLYLMNKIKFEIPAIAERCRNVFLENKTFYDEYIPEVMLDESNDFYNFMQDSFPVFRNDDYTTLSQAWSMYKEYVDDCNIQYPLSQIKFKAELKNYFENYEERKHVDDKYIRNYYSGLRIELFEKDKTKVQRTKKEDIYKIELIKQPSYLDEYCKDCKAQYGSLRETPQFKWDDVTTTLKDLDTSKLHYLKVPENLIVIDFDMKDEHGNKSFEKNLEEASKWPKTYAETSKSGGGIHLHYLYSGDVNKLSRIYSEDIEIKVFTGGSSLRRKVTICNNEEIATISTGLPLREVKEKMINFETSNLDAALTTFIKRNINKEYHSSTVCSVDFIYKGLEEAYNSGKKYDVSKMYNSVLGFAASSTHQSQKCIQMVTKMHFKSDDAPENVELSQEMPLVMFDIEVFPNVWFLNWKVYGKGKPMVRWINPKKEQLEEFFKYRLIGFNNRRYDNHIIYAAYLGYSNLQLYELSQQIVGGKSRDCFFGNAYNLSYTDIYDYCGNENKMSLKKWEIKLKLHHMELGLPWDKPVDESLWKTVSEYCDNDVLSTEAVFDNTQADYTARLILAKLAKMTPNDTTNSLTIKLIFGNDKNPELVYKDISKEFPGYEYIEKWEEVTDKKGALKKVHERHNMYMGTDVGFGGYVYAEPNTYWNVALLDVNSMHPNSAIQLNAFGKYTARFQELVNVRLFIKHKQFDKAKQLFNGELAEYLADESMAKKLSKALKTAINSVYGLTSASFANPFRHPDNVNNIVALRGALFMRLLQSKVEELGYTVAHIKTDSIKIPNADMRIIDYCMKFANSYGYVFEHEATYDRMCLVNDAVYIAKYATKQKAFELYGEDYVMSSKDILSANKEHWDKNDLWTATGTQFQIPYVFKKLFSKEEITFDDVCETRQVTNSAMYLKFDNNTDEPDLRFIGRVGLFCPIKPGCGGGNLVKQVAKKDGTVGYDSVTGCDGYLWLEAEDVVNNNLQNCIDYGYYNKLVDKAIDTLAANGADYDYFVN